MEVGIKKTRFSGLSDGETAWSYVSFDASSACDRRTDRRTRCLSQSCAL